MILKFDTTKRERIFVELLDKNKKIDKLSEKQKHSSQALLPLIDKILKKNKHSLRSNELKHSLWSSSFGTFDILSTGELRTAGLKKYFKGITAIEVNTGPGSFTGTRVGVAVANALGFALDIPVNGSPRSPREAGKKGKIVLPKYTKSKFD